MSLIQLDSQAALAIKDELANLHQQQVDLFAKMNGYIDAANAVWSGALADACKARQASIKLDVGTIGDMFDRYIAALDSGIQDLVAREKEVVQRMAAEQAATAGVVAGGVAAAAVTAGGSVRPVQGGSITSWPSASHNGVDYGFKGVEGAEIVAAKGGKVVTVVSSKDPAYNTLRPYPTTLTNDDYGNYVVIEDEDGKRYIYAHMQSTTDIKVGDNLIVGDTLGYVGNTGFSTGPHLHFEMKDSNGNQLNPLTELGIGNE